MFFAVSGPRNFKNIFKYPSMCACLWPYLTKINFYNTINVNSIKEHFYFNMFRIKEHFYAKKAQLKIFSIKC